MLYQNHVIDSLRQPVAQGSEILFCVIQQLKDTYPEQTE
ncbi:hypothetical protein yrohd0001_21660 [Yersinia rohdei ATCC 43380]|nr:hypothetical protein yrohd0001_21660 [Yersinia rohdei ATCC 43380]